MRYGHRHRLNSQLLLQPSSLMLSSISPGDPLDGMAVAVLAIDTNRRVFDDDGVLSPAEIIPPTWRQVLVDTLAPPTTRAAARQPTASGHQDKNGAAQHARMVRVGDAHAIGSLEVMSHSKSVKAKNLCQSTTALSHPMPSFGLTIDRRHTRNNAGVLGQRSLKPTARHVACSATSDGRLTARGAPGSRRSPLTKRREAGQIPAKSPPPVHPKSGFSKTRSYRLCRSCSFWVRRAS